MKLWHTIRENLVPRREPSTEVRKQLRLATGALLIEMSRADFQVTAEERTSLARALRDVFELDAGQTRKLVEEAQHDSQAAVSLSIYTSLIDEHADRQERIRLIEQLWKVAYADGELHRLEERLVLRVAKLLGVPAKQVGRTRVEAAERAGLALDQLSEE